MTDRARREQAEANYLELSARVEAEMQVGWAFKTSIESRSLGLFALNLGVVTLYLALSEGFSLAAPNGGSPFFYWVLWGSFAAAAASLTASVVATLPANYKAFTIDFLRQSYKHAKDADTELLPDLLQARITALERLRAVNTYKARWVLASVIAAFVSILGFAATVLRTVLM